MAGRIPPMPRPIEALVHADALAANLARARAARAGGAQGLGGRQGQCLRPRHRARLRRPAAAPTASRCSTSARPSCCASSAGAARSCCSKAASSRATSTPARAWTSGTRCTTRRRSTGWRRTRPHRRTSVFLKMNSGMNRLGFTPAAYRAAWLRLDALPQVDEITLMTHLAERRRRATRRSSSRARRLRRGHRRPARRRARSATAPRPCASARGSRASARRLGAPGHPALRLVARLSAAQRRRLGPAPAMSLRAELIAVQTLAAGDERRLRQQLHRRARAAHRRRRLRLCRRLSAPGAGRNDAARRCWSTACARAPSAASRWT